MINLIRTCVLMSFVLGAAWARAGGHGWGLTDRRPVNVSPVMPRRHTLGRMIDPGASAGSYGPTLDFQNRLFLELGHLSPEAALALVEHILTGPMGINIGETVNVSKSPIVINWPYPGDGDVPALVQSIEAMWRRVMVANGPGRSPDALMTMDAPVGSTTACAGAMLESVSASASVAAGPSLLSTAFR